MIVSKSFDAFATISLYLAANFESKSPLFKAFSNSGKLLWEKHLRNFQSPSFNFLTNDFVAVFTDSGTKLSLLNPDGIELWSKDFNYKIIDKAFSGSGLAALKIAQFYEKKNTQNTCKS